MWRGLLSGARDPMGLDFILMFILIRGGVPHRDKCLMGTPIRITVKMREGTYNKNKYKIGLKAGPCSIIRRKAGVTRMEQRRRTKPDNNER